MAISARTWDRLIETEVGNHVHRLYGGAQYHRAMREFNLATRCLRLPNISEDEIANAAGIGDTHDGVNFLRAACIISLDKTRMSFDPLLDALRMRNERSSGALKRALPDQSDIVNIYQVAVKAAEEGKNKPDEQQSLEATDSKTVSNRKSSSDGKVLSNSNNINRDYSNLLQLMEEAACSRNAGRTNMVVGGLVQHIVSQWRETFARSVTTKFNCYFLMPFVDEFHKYLRLELQKVYDN